MIAAEPKKITKYQLYPEYKDSGVEWLGNIPKNWEMWKLAHAYEVIGSGTTPPTSEEGWFGDGIPWVTTGELRENIIEQTSKCITSEALNVFSALRVHPAGSVVIAMYGATIGRLGILGVSATTNQACCVLTRSIDLDNKYVFYWLQAFKDDIVRLSSGGGQPNINQEKVASLKISAPDEQHQRTIAAFLDYETARIDRLIAQQQRLIELLKEKRQAVISHAVTKGLNPNAPMKDSGIEWLGQVPEHWVVTKVKDATYRIVDGPHFSPKYQDEGYMFISARNIKVDRWSLDDAKYVSESDFLEFNKRVKPESGDVLLTKGGTTGIARVVDLDFPFQVWVHVAVLKTNKRKVNPFYLAYTLNSKSGYEQSQLYTRGATNNDLGLSRIANIYFAAPKIQEQEEIVSWLDTACSKLDYLCHRAECSMELLQERRIALISAAVTGKIDLRGWTPPAEEAAA